MQYSLMLHPQHHGCRLGRRSNTAAVVLEAGNVDHQLSAADPDYQPGCLKMHTGHAHGVSALLTAVCVCSIRLECCCNVVFTLASCVL